MSRHNHSHCSHDLKYCDHCDVVYCTKCDREWSGHKHEYWYWSGVPYRVTWTSTGITDGGYYAIYNANTNIRCTDENVISAYNLQAQTGELSSACTHHN